MTDDWYAARATSTFSDDGKYLLLTSSRDFKPIFGEEEFANVYRDMERVYLVTLAKETEIPLGAAQRRSRQSGKEKDKEKEKEDADDKSRREESLMKKGRRKEAETAKPKKPVS